MNEMEGRKSSRPKSRPRVREKDEVEKFVTENDAPESGYNAGGGFVASSE